MRIQERALPIALAVLFLTTTAFAADAERGKDAFVKCHFCHQVGRGVKNTVGPTLNGVVGRSAASVPGYDYSKAMRASGKIWDEATLRAYLALQAAAVPGTKMTFAGISSTETIDDVIDFLRQFRADGTLAP